MEHNHATPVREEKSECHQYHDSTNSPLMVSMFSVLLHAINTTKNSIDDANTFAIVHFKNDVEAILIQRVSKKAYQ
jgi:hypothetical protein